MKKKLPAPPEQPVPDGQALRSLLETFLAQERRRSLRTQVIWAVAAVLLLAGLYYWLEYGRPGLERRAAAVDHHETPHRFT